MTYSVEFAPSAVRDFKGLTPEARRRIARTVDSLAEDPRRQGTKKLSGSDNVYRARAGDYRILYQIDDDVLRVLVIRIGHRREAYRD